MAAEMTPPWRASWISVEYETVLTVLLEKSDGMMRIPRMKATSAIVMMRRRASGAMGWSPLGTYFL